MIGTLNETQVNALLDRILYGHLGCQAGGKLYVVPISFARDGDILYGHTTDGLKIDIMRENPNVCVQVDEVKDLAEWESAIVWGRYEELKDKDEIEAMVKLIDRYGPIFDTIPDADERGRDVAPPRLDGRAAHHVLYRVKITEKSGRFETKST